MQKKNTQKSEWWTPILAPFRLLRVEKIYFTWVFILLISYAGCFVDLLNGEIGESLPKAIRKGLMLTSASFAMFSSVISLESIPWLKSTILVHFEGL